MPIPPFQKFFLPFLKLTSDGDPHSLSDLRPKMAEALQLTPEDLEEKVPSGKQTRFNNRIYWTRTHLTKAVLLESCGDRKFKISQRGKDVIKDNPDDLNLRYLSRFSEFQDFRGGSRVSNVEEVVLAEPDSLTPDEKLAALYGEMRNTLAQELRERLARCSWRFFEDLVLDLLVAMGYGGSRLDAENVGRSGDGGIDGIIREDRLGLDVIYVQAKRWQETVPIGVIRNFIGAIDLKGATKGVLITTGKFPKRAEEELRGASKKVVLIDGNTLAGYLIDYSVGVRITDEYEIKKVDEDYFLED